MPQDFKRVEDIFLAAVEKTDPAERALFLQTACGEDVALRLQVEVLLEKNEPHATSAESPGLARGASVDTTDAEGEQKPNNSFVVNLPEMVGNFIGPYKLLQKLGAGAVGDVWLADQTQPVKRHVALKVIKPGLDSTQVLRRFKAERQALALMDHSGIAKVLDAGTTDAGRPYFVMELVQGVPITRYCDGVHLPVRERLALFVPVCQAIQHAHQKGIIHRDIKPSNVLVCMQDGRALPKVIDFGVAKALHQRLGDESLYTEIGAIVGTLEYMSPEQAEMSPLGVDTRTDVYSLGVLLYELLTGTTPLGRGRLRRSAYSEMVRLIREELPPKPSTRLTHSTESLAAVATQRRTEPTRLSKELRGDLDWIVMKALEKDRTRRYEAASDLARDVERYLHNEPVEARPPSAFYRLSKSVSRNKGPVLAGIGLFLLLIAGIIGTSWGMVRTERALREALQARAAEAEQRELAEVNERKAQANEQKALAAAAAEKQAKETAVAREAETQAVLEFVENKVFAAALPEELEGGLGRDVTLRRAVEAALPFVDQGFQKQPLIEARLRNSLGFSFWRLGDAKTAADQFQKARTIYASQLGADHPDTLRSLHLLANSYQDLGRHAEALKLREDTLARRKAILGPDQPATLLSMNALAQSYDHLGRYADALKLNEETLVLVKAKLGPDDPQTLESMWNLASSYHRMGRFTEARQLHEETLALRRTKFGPEHRDTLKSIYALANTYEALGRTADALRLREESLAIRKVKFGPDHPQTLDSMNTLAASYAHLGRFADAAKLVEETLALQKAKYGLDHPETLNSMSNLATSYQGLGRYADALKLLEQTLVLQKAKLGPEHPHAVDTMYNLACCNALLVPSSTDRGKQADLAMNWLNKAVTAGFKNLAQIKQDTDLDSLRDRDDFRRTVADLETKLAADKK
jgi:serine/threonine protein kinase